MGLFPHLSRVRIWMLRVTMLIRMNNWLWLSDGESHFSIGSMVQKTSDDEKRYGRSVGWSGRSSLRKLSYSAKTRSAASLVISSSTIFRTKKPFHHTYLHKHKGAVPWPSLTISCPSRQPIFSPRSSHILSDSEFGDTQRSSADRRGSQSRIYDPRGSFD